MGKIELRVQVEEHLLEQAAAADIPIESAAECALRAKLSPAASEEKARRWAAENAEFIEAHNRFVEEFGAFSAE